MLEIMNATEYTSTMDDPNGNFDVKSANLKRVNDAMRRVDDTNNNANEFVKETIPIVEKIGTDYTYTHQLVWKNVIGWAILHLCGAYGSVLILTHAKLATTVWTFIIGYLTVESITIGAHRLYTHRAFKASKLVRFVLITLQTMAGQNCLFIWARDHRLHHKFSDTDADPHNANRGFFFSHIGWLMIKKHPLVLQKGRTIDLRDLLDDKLVMFQKEHYKKLYFVLAFLIPIMVPVYFWNENLWTSMFVAYFARYIITLNGTWTVNSLAHLYGTQPFDKGIMPKENTFVGFISSGEGWHNYHHAFPWDYKAAEFGQKYNFSATVIEWLEKHGHTWGLRYVSEDMARKRILRAGDGTHHTYGNGYKEALKREKLERRLDQQIG